MCQVTKPCGHVICKSCVDRFMAPQKILDSHATDTVDPDTPGRILCYVCETDVTERKASLKEGKKEREKDREKIRPGLVAISSEGTGFAGGGVSIAKKAGTACRC